MNRALVLLALAGLLFAAWSISAPDRAQAFAWKDTCTFKIWNQTGSAGNVRPYVYFGIPPNTISEAEYVALAATGVPTNFQPELDNTGIPLTGGCTAILKLYNPGSNVDCAAAAPTQGANAFSCDGNSSFKIYQDDDDIKGDVIVPKGASIATHHSPISVTATTLGAGILHRADLRGVGWRHTRKVSDFGEFGQLVNSDPLPTSCDDPNKQREASPLRGGASAFVRGSGTQAAGALYGVYSSVGKSRQTLNAAISAHSIHCLALLLTSKGLRSHVSTHRRSATDWRLVIHRPGKSAVYLDVIGLRHGRANALVLFISSRKPTSATIEGKALAAVAGRLR